LVLLFIVLANTSISTATHQTITNMPAANASGKKRVILGLMTFGPDKDAGGRVTDLEEYKGVLQYFVSQGYHEVDTAHSYVGTKQQAFTRAAGWKEMGLKLATKFYPSEAHGGHTAANLREKLEWNLKELGTDCVDIFYLHAADRNTNFAETLEACNTLHKEGKFKELGVSNFTSYEVAEAVMICTERGWVRPTIYQGMYNAISELTCFHFASTLFPPVPLPTAHFVVSFHYRRGGHTLVYSTLLHLPTTLTHSPKSRYRDHHRVPPLRHRRCRL
jgi:hypothetical protein